MKCNYAEKCGYPAGTDMQEDGPRHVVITDLMLGLEEEWHQTCHADSGCEVCVSTIAVKETW